VLPTLNNYGGQLGLVNVINNGDVNNHLFAIEIDTFQNVQYKYPSSSHVGVGVSLIATYDFCETCFPSFFVNKGIFGAWIVYIFTTGTLKLLCNNSTMILLMLTHSNFTKLYYPILSFQIFFSMMVACMLDFLILLEVILNIITFIHGVFLHGVSLHHCIHSQGHKKIKFRWILFIFSVFSSQV
jgi:hypothetical protein